MGIFNFFKKNKNNENNEDIEKDLDKELEEIKNLGEEEILSEKNEDDLNEEEILLEKNEDDLNEEEILLEKNEDNLEEIINEISFLEDEEEIVDEEIENFSEENVEKEKQGFFQKMFSGLDKTRQNIVDGLEFVLSGFKTINEDLYEELEEVLIMADIGVDTSLKIISDVKIKVKENKIHEVSKLKEIIVEVISEILTKDNTEFELASPAILLVIGVNGVGKTTSIGKLANIYKNKGKKVLLAAADTFRAAAIDQLEIWGQRSNIDVIKQEEGSDPAAIVFDAVQAAKARKIDLLIVDTAGRLHNKKNLMDELSKINRIIKREYEEAQIETLLVLDSTTGQNALQQAKQFNEVADITGIILTKLDGTSKGGIVIAIKNELNIPVRFVGVGEQISDLQEFNSVDFARALFSDGENIL